MIERETLLKVARDAAAQRMKARPSLLSAYLTGSVAAREPLLGDATDIDLILIDSAPPPAAREIVRLTDQVVLDILHRHKSEYDNPRDLRLHPWRGPEMAEPVFLFDPTHFFELAQAAARGQFHRSDYAAARARTFAAWARDELRVSLLPGLGAAPPVTIASLGRGLLCAANAVITLTDFPGAGRRLVFKLEAAAQKLRRPDLYESLVGLWGVKSLRPEHARAWLTRWSAAYRAGANPEDELIHPARASIYERGFLAQIAADRAVDGLWLMLHTWQACLRNLPTDSASADQWVAFLQFLGMGTPADFAERVRLAQAYVTLAHEAVEDWASKNGA